MGYRILNVDFNEQLESEIYRKTRLTEKELRFDTGRKSKNGEYKIEELDYFTAQYKNEEDFYNTLVEYKYINEKTSTTKSITISHTSRARLIQDEVIYNDKTVVKTAIDFILKKREAVSNKRKEVILLDNSDEVLEFIDYIKNLALDEVSRKYLVGPYPFFSDMEEVSLREMIPQEVYDANGVIKTKGLKGLLKDYINYTEIYNEAVKNNDDVLEASTNLDAVNSKIDKLIRGNYRVFRNLIVWESRYEKILKKELALSTDVVTRNTLSVLLEEVKLQKSYRNKKISREALEAFYEEKKDRLEYIPEEDNHINNEELERMYQEGGIEKIMANVDADTLYSRNSNIKDIEVLSKKEHKASSFHGKK